MGTVRLRRALLVLLLIVTVGMLALAAYALAERQNYLAAEQRLADGLPEVGAGMTKSEVRSLLGRPTFDERELTPHFSPTAGPCRRLARSSYIYQTGHAWYVRYPPRQTVVVFFDDSDRVTCVERTNAFRVLYN
jgi:hypothetical protein